MFTSTGNRDILYGDYNHYIVIVGWGTDHGENGLSLDYWLIKNSWGNDWGENGYMKMVRGINSHGINTLVSYAQASTQTYNQTVINNNNSTNNSSAKSRYYHYRLSLSSLLSASSFIIIIIVINFQSL